MVPERASAEMTAPLQSYTTDGPAGLWLLQSSHLLRRLRSSKTRKAKRDTVSYIRQDCPSTPLGELSTISVHKSRISTHYSFCRPTKSIRVAGSHQSLWCGTPELQWSGNLYCSEWKSWTWRRSMQNDIHCSHHWQSTPPPHLFSWNNYPFVLYLFAKGHHICCFTAYQYLAFKIL